MPPSTIPLTSSAISSPGRRFGSSDQRRWRNGAAQPTRHDDSPRPCISARPLNLTVPRKQSGGEFASSGAPARAQDATLQISGIGATLSERSCRRPQYLQPPAPSRLPVDASDLPIRSSGALAQRDQRRMTTVRVPRILTRTPQLDSALDELLS